MIFWRIREVFEAGGELLQAKAELATKRAQRMLVGSVVVVLVLLAGLLGLAVIIAGIAVEVAQVRGWGESLMIVGGGLVLLCIGVLLIGYGMSSSRRKKVEQDEKRMTPEKRLREAKSKISIATNMHARDPHAPPPPPRATSAQYSPTNVDELKIMAMNFVARHPLAFGAGALLAVAVIGPKRIFRYASRGAAAAGAVNSMMESMSGDQAPEPAPTSGVSEPSGDAAASAKGPRPERAHDPSVPRRGPAPRRTRAGA